MAKNDQFTIGWISPLPLEKEAARLVFDEEYPQDEIHHQNTFYLGGRIGAHKVVLGVQRQKGLNQAAILAEKMRAGFPNVKYFLVVGIAGGVPRYGPAGAVSEIVLGDVAVSSPRGNHGGVRVVVYDTCNTHHEQSETSDTVITVTTTANTTAPDCYIWEQQEQLPGWEHPWQR